MRSENASRVQEGKDIVVVSYTRFCAVLKDQGLLLQWSKTRELAWKRYVTPLVAPCINSSVADILAQRLKSALWLSIGKIVDEETIKLGANATPQFIGALTEMVWAQIGVYTLPGCIPRCLCTVLFLCSKPETNDNAMSRNVQSRP